MNKQDLLEIKYTLKIYIRIIFYIDNLFLIKNRSLTSSEGENISDALIQHGLFRRGYDEVNSYSFTQFMLQNMFTKICSESHTGNCDEYDELSKLFKNIGLNNSDIKNIKKKLFELLDKINAKITQTEKVKAMKAKIKKLIMNLNIHVEQKDIEAILNEIKKLLGEKGPDGQPLMDIKELQALINAIFTGLESSQDEEGLNRLAGRKIKRDTINPSTATQTDPEKRDMATQPEPEPPVNDTTDANLIAAALIANMGNQLPTPAEPKPEPPKPPAPQEAPPVNDTTDANLIAAALIANMDNKPLAPEPPPEPPPKPPAPPEPPAPPAPPPVNDTTDANLIAAALIANMDNQPPPPAPAPAPAPAPPEPLPAPAPPAPEPEPPVAPTEAQAAVIKEYNDSIGVHKLTDNKLYESLLAALHNNNEKIFIDAMDKTHYENLLELKKKYSNIVKKNYPNNKSKMVEECLTLLKNKIASIINPQLKVSVGQNKSKGTKKNKIKGGNKKTRKK